MHFGYKLIETFTKFKQSSDYFILNYNMYNDDDMNNNMPLTQSRTIFDQSAPRVE